jgi:hypothetical protein
MTWLIAIGIGLVAGVSSGLFGIGGGILIVPMLVLLLGFEQTKAQGTSLAVLLAPVGLLGVMNYWNAQKIDLVMALWMAGGMFLGAYFGSKIAVGIDPVMMRRVFAGFLVVVAVYLAFKQ